MLAEIRTKGRSRVSRVPSHTMTGAAAAATRSIQGKPNQTAAKNNGPRTAADRIRSSSPRNRRSRATGVSAANATITPLAPTELGNCPLQIVLAEIGPQRIDEYQLRVCELPQQEIWKIKGPALPSIRKED